MQITGQSPNGNEKLFLFIYLDKQIIFDSQSVGCTDPSGTSSATSSHKYLASASDG